MANRRSSSATALSKRVQQAFGKRLQEIRRTGPNGRFQQADLAGALEVTRTTISNIENGRHRVFLDQVYAAAQKLGVSVERLLPALEEVLAETPVKTPLDVSLKEPEFRAVENVARRVMEREIDYVTEAGPRRLPREKRRR